MKKALYFIPVVFLFSCGDLFLGDQLIEERAVIPGIYHSVSFLGSLSNGSLLNHQEAIYTDVNPVGRCEDPIDFRTEYVFIDIQGNVRPIELWDNIVEYFFVEINDKKLAHNRTIYQRDNGVFFVYKELSSDLIITKEQAIDFSSYFSNSYLFDIKLFEVNADSFYLIGGSHKRDRLEYFVAKVIDGEVSETFLYTEPAVNQDFVHSEPFKIGNKYFFLSFNFYSGKTVDCYEINLEENKIEKISSLENVDWVSSETFPVDGHLAFLGRADGKLKVFSFNENEAIFKTEEILSSVAFSPEGISLNGIWESQLAIEFKTQNEERHLGLIRDKELIDLGKKGSRNGYIYFFSPEGELFEIQNINSSEGKSAIWFNQYNSEGLSQSKLLYDGVAFRTSCNWFD